MKSCKNNAIHISFNTLSFSSIYLTLKLIPDKNVLLIILVKFYNYILVLKTTDRTQQLFFRYVCLIIFLRKSFNYQYK